MKKPIRTLKCSKQALTAGFLSNLQSIHDLQITDAALPGLQFRYSARTGHKVFYLWYRVRGTPTQRHIRIGSLIEFTLSDIRAMAIELRRDIANGEDPHLARRERAKIAAEREARRVKVKDLFPIFLDKHCKENNRRTTLTMNEGYFRNYIEPMLGNQHIEDIDLGMVQDFYNRVKNTSTASIGDHLIRALSSFLTWCEKYNHRPINSNPCGRVQKAKIAKFKPTLLNPEGYHKLLSALDDALVDGTYAPQAILALKALMLTGCRLSEITDLERDELDLENGYLHLKKRKTDFFDVPLGEPAIDVIRQALKICKSRRYVFHSSIDHNKPIVDLRRAFWWALSHAGLPRMRIHDLRHSFATMATAIGEDIRTPKDVLGHTKITTTEIYAHTSTSAARRTANNVAGAIVGMTTNE